MISYEQTYDDCHQLLASYLMKRFGDKEEIDVIFEEIAGTLHGRENTGMLSSRWTV